MHEPIILEHSMYKIVVLGKKKKILSGLPSNRVLLQNHEKAKTTKKYFETKYLFKDLKIFFSGAKNE